MAADWREDGSASAGVNAGAGGTMPRKAYPDIPCWGNSELAPNWAFPTESLAWVDQYEVNSTTLIRVGNECTRYGLIEVGGHSFIVGPTPSRAEAQTLARMLKTYVQIGAIFSVEPGTMQLPRESSDVSASGGVRNTSATPVRSGYIKCSIREFIGGAERQRPHRRDAAAHPSPANLEGGLSHVQFMEFEGMERREANINASTLWSAGQGIAEFMRQNPGKIALVCSERGISRPCAVVASAALQLRDGDTQVRNHLVEQVVKQRSAASDHHILAASHGFDLVAELARLVAMLRSPGRGEPSWERKVHLLRQHLPELASGANSDVDWQSDEGRCQLAGALEANFERVAPLLASGGLPPGSALLWLRGEVNVLSGVRFLSPAYIAGHTDRISQESIDPKSPDAVRLVVFDDYGLTCDNKYYDATCAAAWHRQCVQGARPMTNPISRAPVVALLVQSSEKTRLERLFRASSE